MKQRFLMGRFSMNLSPLCCIELQFFYSLSFGRSSSSTHNLCIRNIVYLQFVMQTVAKFSVLSRRHHLNTLYVRGERPGTRDTSSSQSLFSKCPHSGVDGFIFTVCKRTSQKWLAWTDDFSRERHTYYSLNDSTGRHCGVFCSTDEQNEGLEHCPLHPAPGHNMACNRLQCLRHLTSLGLFLC